MWALHLQEFGILLHFMGKIVVGLNNMPNESFIFFHNVNQSMGFSGQLLVVIIN